MMWGNSQKVQLKSHEQNSKDTRNHGQEEKHLRTKIFSRKFTNANRCLVFRRNSVMAFKC